MAQNTSVPFDNHLEKTIQNAMKSPISRAIKAVKILGFEQTFDFIEIFIWNYIVALIISYFLYLYIDAILNINYIYTFLLAFILSLLPLNVSIKKGDTFNNILTNINNSAKQYFDSKNYLLSYKYYSKIDELYTLGFRIPNTYKYDDFEMALCNLAECCSKLGYNEEAISHYTTLIGMDKDEPDFFYQRAILRFYLNLFDDCINDIENIRKLTSESYSKNSSMKKIREEKAIKKGWPSLKAAYDSLLDDLEFYLVIKLASNSEYYNKYLNDQNISASIKSKLTQQLIANEYQQRQTFEEE